MCAISPPAQYFYVNEAFVKMREGPADSTKVVSEVFYAEKVSPLIYAGDWVRIRSDSDFYIGWVKRASLIKKNGTYPVDPSQSARINRLAAHVYGVPDIEYGPILTLPFDSRIEVLDQTDPRFAVVILVDGTRAYIQKGDFEVAPKLLSLPEMLILSKAFLGLPYTWGGRSFAFDCSGFVQMLYRQMGFSLPRDAKDQINWYRFKEVSLTALQPGDLIFFGLEQDQIIHVGLYLGCELFIHATSKENQPWIRISSLNDSYWNGTNHLAYRAARTLK